MSDYPTEWRELGACVTIDPELFFPVAVEGVSLGQAEDTARQICAGCHVQRQCLQFAIEMGEMDGIWGGTTPEERGRPRRKQAAARRSVAGSAPGEAPREAPGVAA